MSIEEVFAAAVLALAGGSGVVGLAMTYLRRYIDREHAGTLDDPIPWVSGMDCLEGQYYSYEGHVYVVDVGGTMKPSIYPPGTPSLWQFKLVK